MNNPFGISDKSYSLLMETIRSFPEIEKVILFGSRAMGNYKKGSDIDLAITGTRVAVETALHLKRILNHELPIPYHVDVVPMKSVNNPGLKAHIAEHGKTLWKREDEPTGGSKKEDNTPRGSKRENHPPGTSKK